MKCILKVPSKTFLLGEYLALVGGPSLVLNTRPYFSLEVTNDGEGSCQGIKPQSPAGKWIRQNNISFRNYDLKFTDPHEERGGFGASTAQFLLTYVWEAMQDRKMNVVFSPDFQKKMWIDYRQTAWTEVGPLPSGADLIGQLNGHVTEFKSQPFFVKQHQWPFPEIDFFIVRTGNKVATHKHLETLDEKSFDEMRESGLAAVNSFSKGIWPDFMESLNQFYGLLCEKHLICEQSRVLVKKIIGWSMVKVVKACGALGADTVLVFCHRNDTSALRQKLAEESLEVVAETKDLDAGLVLQGEAPQEENAHV